MGLLKNLFGFGPKRIPILKAIITFDEDNNVSVELEKLHPEFKSPEYIRMILHYYAKMLYIIDPNQPESVFAYNQLLTSIDNISNAKLKDNPNILKIADIDDVVKLARPKKQHKRYVATLFEISGVVRHITTGIPIRGYLQQMTFSVPILIQSILQYLNYEDIEVLQLALKSMNEQYRNGVNFRDIKIWESVPNKAFLSCIQKRLYFPACMKCGEETSKSGNLTNMILSGITDPDEFNRRYGMMCADHTAEITQKIIQEKNLTEIDLANAHKKALKVMAEEFSNL